MTHNKIKISTIIVSITVFIISLTQDFVSTNSIENETVSSLDYFIRGSSAFLGGGLLEWIITFVNPLCVISIILLIKRNRYAMVTSTIAFLLALSFTTLNEPLETETGNQIILSFEPGFYLWLLSILILTFGTFSFFISKDKYKKNLLSNRKPLPS